MNKSKILTVARNYCANWNVGKCLGCVFTRDEGYLSMCLDDKKVGKSCSVEDGCDYFQAIVMPGIVDDRDLKTIKSGERNEI
mgnify:FL=1